MVFSKRRSPPGRDLRALIGALGIPALHQVAPRCAAELRRARRYERPLSVLFVSTAGRLEAGSGDDLPRFPIPVAQATPPAFMAFVLLGSFLLRTLRENDILASASDGLHYVIMLPEADELDAQRTLRRLTDSFTAFASLRLRTGFAHFPRDGVTLESLLEHASHAWQTGLQLTEAAKTREASRA